ncbi:hypothetical protein RB195_009706 [Necator americanus]
MERFRRLRESMTATEPRSIIETTIRLALASTLNFYLSQYIFDNRLIPFLEDAFRTSPLIYWPAFRTDTERLPKMQRLWPPHANFELAVVFTLGLYMILKYFLRPEHVLEVLSRLNSSSEFPFDDKVNDLAGRNHHALRARLFSAGIVAVSIFTLLLPMQRIGEMHIFVIALNFVHILLLCELSAVLMFLYSERSENKLKEE